MSIDSKQEPVTGIDTNKNLIPTDVYANNLAHTLSHTVDMDTAHIHYVQESMSNADIITFWRKNNIAIIESDDLSDLSSAIKENLFRWQTELAPQFFSMGNIITEKLNDRGTAMEPDYLQNDGVALIANMMQKLWINGRWRDEEKGFKVININSWSSYVKIPYIYHENDTSYVLFIKYNPSAKRTEKVRIWLSNDADWMQSIYVKSQ